MNKIMSFIVAASTVAFLANTDFGSAVNSNTKKTMNSHPGSDTKETSNVYNYTYDRP